MNRRYLKVGSEKEEEEEEETAPPCYILSKSLA